MATKVKSKDLNAEIWVIDFDEEAAQDFRERVLFKSKEQPEEPIVVYIDSYGGNADALAKMIETLDEVPNPIITVCMGKAMSAGAMLLSHGDVRWVGRHSRVMIHEISAGTNGNVHDMYADAIEIKRLNTYFMGLLAKNCNIPGGYEGIRTILKKNDGRDLYLNAAEAVKFGVADFIGTPNVISVITTQAVTVPVKKQVKKPTKAKRKEKA